MSGLRRYDAPGNIRQGQNVRGSRQETLEDESLGDNLPTTSIALFQRKDGKILAVSRGKDLSDMNLPGGGIEAGETPEDAVRRELWEETGFIADKVVKVFEGENSKGVNTAVFKVLSATGKLKSSQEGIARWVEKDELLSSSYGDFFFEIMKKIAL